MYILILLESLGILLSAIAVVVMDFESLHPPMLLVLSLFIVGNLLIAFISHKRKSWGILSLMLFYFALNIYGIYKLL